MFMKRTDKHKKQTYTGIIDMFYAVVVVLMLWIDIQMIYWDYMVFKGI